MHEFLKNSYHVIFIILFIQLKCVCLEGIFYLYLLNVHIFLELSTLHSGIYLFRYKHLSTNAHTLTLQHLFVVFV